MVGSQTTGETGMEVWKTPRTPCETPRCTDLRISEDAASPRPSSSITFAPQKGSETGRAILHSRAADMERWRRCRGTAPGDDAYTWLDL